MNPALITLIQALAPVAVDLAVKLIEVIKTEDMAKLTPEDWLALLKHSQKSSDERLAAIVARRTAG